MKTNTVKRERERERRRERGGEGEKHPTNERRSGVTRLKDSSSQYLNGVRIACSCVQKIKK